MAAVAGLALVSAAALPAAGCGGASGPDVSSKEGAPGLDEYRDELAEEAKETAAEVTAELVNQGIEARAVAAEGHPADVILGQADQEEVGLIVIGGGGGGKKRDYFVGSTVDRVVRHASVPVYVVK